MVDLFNSFARGSVRSNFCVLFDFAVVWPLVPQYLAPDADETHECPFGQEVCRFPLRDAVQDALEFVLGQPATFEASVDAADRDEGEENELRRFHLGVVEFGELNRKRNYAAAVTS